MTEQELFETDCRAAFPNRWSGALNKDGAGDYVFIVAAQSFEIWRQQAARHKAEIAELNETIRKMSELVQASFAFTDKQEKQS